MEGLISTFHIDVKIIIAQIVNFAIVFVVLYVFALKPLAKLMRERRAEIEKGLTDAKSSETELLVAKQKAEVELKKARAEANVILGEAKKKSDLIISDANKKAEEKIKESTSQAKNIILKEREQMEKELLEKTAGLVSLGVKKILDEDIDAKKNESINKRALEILKKL
jgi:F-type H+-transporting ATPase subunit b